MQARPTRNIARHEILLPIKFKYVLASLAIALLLNLLPWFGIGRLLRPDFVALVLLHWCVFEPRKVGFIGPWLMGLLMDVADGSLFGQHALAYSLLAFASIVIHRRVQNFNLAAQMIYVALVLFMAEAVMLLIRLIGGAGLPDWAFFSGALVGAALWPLLTAVLKIPRRPRVDPDRV